MKTLPIIFNREMVRAILDRRKTQTRRIVKPQPPSCYNDGTPLIKPFVYTGLHSDGIWHGWKTDERNGHGLQHASKCPYGKVGDKLWVKQTFWHWGTYVKTTETCNKLDRPKERFIPVIPKYGNGVLFEAPDHPPADRYHIGYHKRPSIFMSKIFTEITLEITAIRVERVQDISEDDAIAEGIEDGRAEWGIGITPKGKFANLWDSIYKKRGYGWKTNPWVWVVEFRRIDK